MEIILYLTGAIFIVAFVASLLLNWFLYKSGNNLVADIEFYKKWNLYIKNCVMQTYIKIKAIDHKEIFQKDDEVGVVFTDIVNTLEVLNDITQTSDLDDDVKLVSSSEPEVVIVNSKKPSKE